ncbi:MAG: hypothetical protein J6K88_01560 [Oscillospiraceae bacterium]|nr:hypothetical protein [Oscillospiraceae bacterium]
MTFKEKVRNIWDYDKWFIIGGIFVAIMVFLFIKDVFFKETADFQIVSVSVGYLSKENVETTERYFSSFAPDKDGDGVSTVNLLNIEFSPEHAKNPQLDRDASTQLIAELSLQQNCLFIIDKANFEAIWKGDYSSLCDLSSLSEKFEEGTFFIPISQTAIKDNLPFYDEDLLFIIRIPYDNRYKDDYELYLKLAESLLNS